MSILFINGSPNKNGNTAELAERLLSGKEYQTLHLVENLYFCSRAPHRNHGCWKRANIP